MTNIIQTRMTFALSSNGPVVHVDDVDNGAQCNCICAKCRRPLIAKNRGQERVHHFAHESSTECEGGTETSLHLAAKQIIADHKRIALPTPIGTIGEKSFEIAEFDSVQLEFALLNSLTQKRIIVDCYGRNSMDVLIIEIAVHHYVDDRKITIIESLGVPALEIDLNDQIGELLDWNDLKRLVLFDTSRRHWIFSPNVERNVSIHELVGSVAGPITMSRHQEWCFALGTTWIWVKELPFGNIRVFHRYDERVRQVVEPICRSRGYWNAQYKNWIVFDKFKAELLELLATQASPVYIAPR